MKISKRNCLTKSDWPLLLGLICLVTPTRGSAKDHEWSSAEDKTLSLILISHVRFSSHQLATQSPTKIVISMSPHEVHEKQLLVDELDNALPIKTRKHTGYCAIKNPQTHRLLRDCIHTIGTNEKY